MSNAREEALLEEVYFDAGHPAGFGSLQSLVKATNLPEKIVKQWLRKQRTYTTHKPVRIRFPTRPYVTRGLDHQWQADLVEMRPFAAENQGYHYLLTVIDMFSRYAMVRPLRRKTANEVMQAFKSIFETEGRKPRYLQTDEGMEFESRPVRAYLQREGIEQFSVKSQFKAAMVERFNRTLKTRMWRAFTHRGNYRWMEILQPLVSAYNQSHHRVLGGRPIDVTKENETRFWLHLYGGKKVKKPHPRKKAVFKVGDRVRISKVKGLFEKGYRPNWSEEVFSVHSVNRKYLPFTYRVSDYRDEVIEGSFYDYELQLVDDSDQVYAIEKVIRTRGSGARKEYLVKWYGYNETSWVKESDFRRLT